jgi:hypothetical protein
MDKIYTAKDYATREGAKDVKDRIKLWQKKHANKGVRVRVTNIENPTGIPARARIWQGIWIADCECGGAEFVSYDEPVFFCWGCGNRSHNGACRPVEFPSNREQIEAKILERPVIKKYGLDDLSLAEGSRAAIAVNGHPLSRSWRPGETLEMLSAQQDDAIKAYKKDKVK